VKNRYRRKRILKKNPLKNRRVMGRLNPYDKVVRKAEKEIEARNKRSKAARAAEIEKKRNANKSKREAKYKKKMAAKK